MVRHRAARAARKSEMRQVATETPPAGTAATEGQLKIHSRATTKISPPEPGARDDHNTAQPTTAQIAGKAAEKTTLAFVHAPTDKIIRDRNTITTIAGTDTITTTRAGATTISRIRIISSITARVAGRHRSTVTPACPLMSITGAHPDGTTTITIANGDGTIIAGHIKIDTTATIAID